MRQDRTASVSEDIASLTDALPPAPPGTPAKKKKGPPPPTKKKRTRLTGLQPNHTTFAGRIDLMLEKRGKKRTELCRYIKAPDNYVSTLHRVGGSAKPARLGQIAKFLNVSMEWLDHGGPVPERGPGVKPQHAVVERAHEVLRDHAPHVLKAQASMEGNIDTTMLALWSLLPMDIKVFVIARMAELWAQQAASKH